MGLLVALLAFFGVVVVATAGMVLLMTLGSADQDRPVPSRKRRSPAWNSWNGGGSDSGDRGGPSPGGCGCGGGGGGD